MTRPRSDAANGHVEDQLAPWLLGELDAVAAAAVERHLDRCEPCRAALRELDDALVASVETLPPQEPSPAVWDAIAARVAGERVADAREPAAERSAERAPPAPPRPRPSAPRPPSSAAPRPTGRHGAPPARPRWGVVATAAVVVVAAGFGAWQFRVAEIADAERLAALARLESVQAELAATHAEAAATVSDQIRLATWLAQTDLRVVSIPGPVEGDEPLGSVVVGADGEAFVVMRDAPAAGRDFQAWGVIDDGVVSLGTFSGRVIEVDAAGFEAVAVSLEPSGGSESPTLVLGAAPLP